MPRLPSMVFARTDNLYGSFVTTSRPGQTKFELPQSLLSSYSAMCLVAYTTARPSLLGTGVRLWNLSICRLSISICLPVYR